MSKDYVTFAAKNIRHRGVRSWLTILGIVIGVAAIISLITVGQGMKNAVSDQFDKLGVRNLRIVPANLQGPPSEAFALPNAFIDKTEGISVVDYIDKVLISSGVLQSGKEERSVAVFGYDVALADKGFADLDLSPLEGRLFVPSDSDAILLGHDVARDTFDKNINVRQNILLSERQFRVIGILEETGSEVDGRVFIPLEEARTLFNRPNDINILAVHLKDGISLEEGQEVIERELLRSFDDEEFDILTPQQILDQINQILGVIQAVLAGIAMISLLVGAVGIMNAMFTSVLERTREIGVMKAVGARNRDIATIFLLEAGIMGTVGGAIGIALGTAMAFAAGFIAQAFGFPFLTIRIDITIVAGALLFAFLIGALSGLIPAIQAAHLKPVDALRYE